MVNLVEVWGEALPEIMNAVTGVGVWTAVRTCKPIVAEEDLVVLGLGPEESELAGHLRLPQPKRAIEDVLSRHFNRRMQVRVIQGISLPDWETEKKRDLEKRKLQEQQLARARVELAAGKSWEVVYEQISRAYSATPNRSLPQNRAKFFLQSIEIVAEALLETPITDELAERNYARCLERIAQYTELPSALVALKVLERSFQA